MLDFSATNITHITAAWVGNKNRYEGWVYPKNQNIQLHDAAEETLLASLMSVFSKNEEFFYLHHEEDPSWNIVQQCAMKIFADPEGGISYQSNTLAQRLYDNCENPKVQGGEFFIIHLQDIMYQGEPMNAIALIKANEKVPTFKPDRNEDTFQLNLIESIPTGKPQVAAIILNLDESEGYLVCAIDTVSKKDERSFWEDDFLRLRPLEDNYFNTRHHMAMASHFINHKAPIKFGLDRIGTMDLLIRAGEYFKENGEFELNDFTQKLLPEEDQQAEFKEFREQYAKAYSVPLENTFDISTQAVKRDFKVFKTVLKLDKNFHLYVHGRCDLIERGYDEDKGKYYKVWFEVEE